MKLRYVGNAPFFSALSEQEQESVSQRMHLEHRRSGEILFRKDEESTCLYLIKSGWVRLQANGGTALASQGSGSLVGETDLFLDRPRSIGAVAATEAELWILSREDLVELIAQDPQIGLKLSLAFGSRLTLLDQYLVEERVKQLPFLVNLDEDGLLAIARRLMPVEKEKGEFVVEGGQAPEALFIVESGQLHLHSTEEGGDFAELGPGESFGEMALLTGKPHSRSAQAATDVTLWMLPVAEFEALADERPEIRLALSKAIREPLSPEDQSRAVERLTTMPLFEGLTEDVLWAVAERLLLHHVPKGELIFAEGSPGDALYLIDSGQIEIVSDSNIGRTVLARLGTDEFFGEMALLTGKPRSTAARCTSHANLWVLYRTDFDDLINRYPSISVGLSKVLSQRLADMDQRFTESHLRGLKLLAGLSPGQLEDVSLRLKPVRFRQGETIIREGAPGDVMYFIESGRVRVVRGYDAQTIILDELGAGDLFGEMALLTGSPRSATVTGLSDVNAWALNQADFEELVATYPNLALALSRLLSERLRSTDERFLKRPAAPAPKVAPQPRPVPKAAPQPSPAPQARPAPRPAPAPKPTRARKPQPVARKTEPGLVAELGMAFEGALAWFDSLSRGAKIRLLLATMVLAWLVCIVAPVLVISTLAADDVTNLQGAIAFIQTSTPVPVEGAQPSDTPESAAAMLAAPVEATAEPIAVQPAELGAAGAVEAPAQAEAPLADTPVQAEPTPVLPTETPWIVIITNTPPPPTDTPIPPTETPVPPTPTPRPTRNTSADVALPTATQAVVERPQPPRVLDPRLTALNVGIEPVGVRPGQSYWRLIEARWENESEAGGGHSIFIDVLDEGGNKVIGQPIEIRWVGGGLTVTTEDKPPDEYAANFPMYNTLGSYMVSVAGLPSDVVVGLGLGTPDAPDFKVHTNFFLKFQRVTR